MAVNDDLAQVKAELTEATTEINAKIDALVAQVGDTADPALVSEIKGLAQGLADIVPDAPEAAPGATTVPGADVPASVPDPVIDAPPSE